MLVLELTTAGWTAVWDWVKQRAQDPEQMGEHGWYQHALRSINLIPPGEDLVVCIGGAASRSGYLEALRLQPGWYRRKERQNVVLEPLF